MRRIRQSPASVLLLLTSLCVLPLSAQSLPAWGTVPSANRNSNTNTLKGIAAISSTDIWSVGEFNPGLPPTVTGRRTLAEHFDGNVWTVVKSPNPTWAGLDFASLGSVAAVSTSDVWAVGYSEDFSSFRLNTLTEHWDGTAWKIIPSPNPAGLTEPNQLFGVTALASNNVWAVGQYSTNAVTYLPLILNWNGSKWKIVTNGCAGGLYGISALSSTDIWAVGYNTSCHYDGSKWTAIPIAPSGGADILYSVSADSSTDVWAVGNSTFCPNEGCYTIAYSAHWDGTKWLRYTVTGGSLNGVLARAANDVWAVGTLSIGTLILHWDGTAWSTVPSPNPGIGGFVNGIAVTGTSDFWAAGAYDSSGANEQTLVLESPSKTQGSLTGNTGVSGSVVSWVGSQTGSVTADVSGHYAAAGLPAGAYTVIATFGGCNPVVQNVAITAGQTTVQNFSLCK
jgi:hypothetical protein